ncbi:MAG TPA: class I SAM-dependent methyltransferase [Verrucomicrobiae bacterium]|nr:class I SAM-dependent methyltransferase [Verrucomicrobiae bacterium]
MTNTPVQFDRGLARIYDKTRPIDPEACRACFRDALQGIVGRTNARIVDVGCGTGRILGCLIPDLLRKEQVVGIDVSSAMLEVARGKRALHGVALHKISVADFANAVENRERFDAVICHWLFHCLPDWRDIFRACANLVKAGGVLTWLEEDGELYRALDGMNTNNGRVNRLFATYYESVNNQCGEPGLSQFDPAARAGAPLRCTDELARELSSCGWIIQKEFSTHRWTRMMTVNWIVRTVLGLRVFTNLRQIPAAVNSAAIADLRYKLGQAGLPKGSDQLEIRYWANAVVAVKETTVSTGLGCMKLGKRPTANYR